MLSRSRTLLAASALALVVSCSARGDAPAPASRPAPDAAPAAELAVEAFVAHRDDRAGARLAPTFTWLARAAAGVRFASADEAAKGVLASLRRPYALDDAAFTSLHLREVDESKGGPIIVRYEQRDAARDLEVFRGGLAIALTRDFDPVSASGLVVRSLAGAERPFTRSASQAVLDAHALLGLAPRDFTSLGAAAGGYERFAASGLAAPARVKKVLYPEDAGVVPAYYVELQVRGAPARSFVVAAEDGHVLLTNELTRRDAYSYRVYADPATKIPLDGPQGNAAAPHPTGRPSGFTPSLGAMSLVTLESFPFSKKDPWLPPGATVTSGNNVDAYPDIVTPDGVGGDAPATVTSASTFDYSYDTTRSPGATATNIAAATTNLFYLTNVLHDWYYDLGFDEASGNHQVDNFGRGGLGGDPLKAEAQDFSGRNNANATVPADGDSPRLQMYVFSGPSAANLEVLTPAPLAGRKPTAVAGFGKDVFDLTGPVGLASDDQGADPLDACETISGNLSGKIALVHRGLCSFIQKAQNVQAAGAVGVIVANVAASADRDVPPFMGGTTDAVTIPALALAYADGKALETAAAAGTATVHLARETATDLDGALDSTVVAHEWGHVISNRLVGNANGLTTNQAGGLGEGWGDFSGLLLMVREDDLASPDGAGWRGAYPNGGYAMLGAGADFYYGIRRVPYSIDFAKDPLTFRHIANGQPLPSGVPIAFGEDGSFNAEVHNVGEVWATMLWECYAALLRDGRYGFAEAQTRMRRYYVASLKLTPVDPTLLEARDAVLAAALATDPGDYLAFWQAFARRGAGVGALGPGKDSATNSGVVESFSADNDVQMSGGSVTDDVLSCDHDGVIDEGEIGTFTFDVRNAGPGALEAPVAVLSSTDPRVVFPDGASLTLPALKPFGKAVTLKVHVQLRGAAKSAEVPVHVSVTDPSFAKGHVATYEVMVRANADQAAESSATDHVDTAKTSWTTSVSDPTGTATAFERVSTGLDAYWSGGDPFVPADVYLTSPAFAVEGSRFELTFKHRYSFRISTRRAVDVDGGVVEVSRDNGKTWKDASAYGAVDYNTTLDVGGRGDNPLKGQKAYGNTSPGYPDAWLTSTLSLDLGGPADAVKVRFHIGAGSGFSGAPGWDIDDVALGKIASTPFWSFVDHADLCDENAPVATAPEALDVISGRDFALEGSGSSPTGAPVTFTWAQLEGPSALPYARDPASARASFIAPTVGAPTALVFELRASDGALLSPGARVRVNVTLPGGVDDGCSTSRRAPARTHGAPFAAGLGLLALVAAGLFARRRLAR
ncbi:MAG: Chitinase [Labilithrix sp.]|nr:Chitinase [Labilithrix sp.]